MLKIKFEIYIFYQFFNTSYNCDKLKKRVKKKREGGREEKGKKKKKKLW